jgi:hypothetical protein
LQLEMNKDRITTCIPHCTSIDVMVVHDFIQGISTAQACRNHFHDPLTARSTPPKCSVPCRIIVVIADEPELSFFVEERFAMRLVEETETHVLVRLLLLLFLLLGLGLLSGGSTASGSTTSATAATAAGRDGGELRRAGGDQLFRISCGFPGVPWCKSYLVDVLALKLAEELVKAVLLSVDADGLEDGLRKGKNESVCSSHND